MDQGNFTFKVENLESY